MVIREGTHTMQTINENLAKRSHDGMSMSDYKPGSATSEWKGMCAKAREAADRALKRAPERADEIEQLYDRYASKAAAYINESNRIGAMCPSVLVTGSANFPTRKKKRQLDAYDSFYKKDWGFDKIIDKLNLIGTGREPIKSGDADAVTKLQKKLDERVKAQDMMKAANAWYRKHKTMDGFEPEAIRKKAQSNLDFQAESLWFPNDEAKAEHMLKAKPFEAYQLSNNNAEIRRLKKRIEELKAAKESEPAEEREITICGEPCTVAENTDNMRLQVFFDGKPSAECRTALKSNGFRWAPSQGAWQRQLTNNARYALDRITD